MRCAPSRILALLAVLMFAVTSGCGDTAKIGKTEKTGKTGEAGHAHELGPHKGHLIELGNEEYHGELVHDEKSGTVTVYILDSTGKNAVPIEGKDVTINVKHGKEAEQFKLASSPDQGDPQGKSSRFVSKDKHLLEDLDAEDTQATLVVQIEGKQYRGKIAHDHADHKD